MRAGFPATVLFFLLFADLLRTKAAGFPVYQLNADPFAVKIKQQFVGAPLGGAAKLKLVYHLPRNPALFGRMLQANPVIATVFAQFPADFLFDVKFGFHVCNSLFCL